ncbi:GIN domain-containing protein [Prevotella ihumii]|uniref:GIN domain-containing protein n=1 Tax=Prevotella ihumii TaxID=1917878 RepID=UPI00098197C6|nr:DUF2807 domain-containing protein [Prevotella ihumii]
MKKIFVMAFNVCLSIVACGLIFTSCIRKKQDLGKEITKNIKVDSFQDIEVLGNTYVEIVPGDTFKVVVEGKEQLVNNIVAKVKDGVLTIDQKEEKQWRKGEISFKVFSRKDYWATVRITMPALRCVAVGGNANINTLEPMQGDSVNFTVDGNGSIDITGLKTKLLQIGVEGNASMDFKNLTAQRTAVTIDGNCRLDSHFVNSGAVEMRIDGNASVNLTGTTESEPVCRTNGNSSIVDNTTRMVKK